MNLTGILLAAGVALAASPALAQHPGHAGAPAAASIATGTVRDGVRTFDVSVTEDGFEPARVKVVKGERTRFVVTRRTDRTCAKEIVFRDLGIERPLPLGKAVTVDFTPARSGEIHYACGMGHVRGVVFVP